MLDILPQSFLGCAFFVMGVLAGGWMLLLAVSLWLPDDKKHKLQERLVNAPLVVVGAVFLTGPKKAKSLCTWDSERVRRWWRSSYLFYAWHSVAYRTTTRKKRQCPTSVRDAVMGFTLGNGVQYPGHVTLQDARPRYVAERPLRDFVDTTQPVCSGTPILRPRGSDKPVTVRKPKPVVVLPPADLTLWQEINASVDMFAAAVRDGRILQPPVIKPGIGATISKVDDYGEDVVVGYVPFSNKLQAMSGWTSQAAPSVSGPIELYIAIDPDDQPVWEVVSYYGVFDPKTGKITYHPWHTGTRRQQPSMSYRLPNGEQIGIAMIDVRSFVYKVLSSMIGEETD